MTTAHAETVPNLEQWQAALALIERQSEMLVTPSPALVAEIERLKNEMDRRDAAFSHLFDEQSAELRRVAAQRDELMAAAFFGGGHVPGPEALEYVAGILERDTKALGWAIILRKKAKRERAAIAKVFEATP